jgi:hypothetical protein
MTKTVLWSSSAGDVPANLAFTNNFAATAAPTVSNDTSQGYSVGSTWVNMATNPDTIYVCTDATKGAAVWLLSATSSAAGQFVAPAATTPTGTGGAASITGGAGGTTSGAGGAASQTGGAATAGNSAGGAATQAGGAGSGSSAGGAATQTGGVGGATGAGGASSVIGGAGGSTSGTGGVASVTGGAGSAGNANGGSVVISGGAANGTGVAGSVRELGLVMKAQADANTISTASTLTGAQLTNGLIVSSPGASINLTLPLQSAMDTAIPDSAANDAFDFSIINTASGNFTVTVLANSWTTVGYLAVGQNVSGRFRARKTGTGAWTLYRLS